MQTQKGVRMYLLSWDKVTNQIQKNLITTASCNDEADLQIKIQKTANCNFYEKIIYNAVDEKQYAVISSHLVTYRINNAEA